MEQPLKSKDPSGQAAHAATARTRFGGRQLPELEPLYYLKNFERVLSTIESRYCDLLIEEESRFISTFRQLPVPSRALLTRLVMRQGYLFRASKLSYAEIGETCAAAGPLITAKWVDDHCRLGVNDFLKLVGKEAAIRCLQLPRRYCAWRKADLAVMLAAQFPQPRYFEEWDGEGDFVYALLIDGMCERFRLMFFGNYGQHWTEFVTADLGIFNYEKVNQSLLSRPFQTRAQIELLVRLRGCRESLAAGMPLGELRGLIPELIVENDWLEDRRQELQFLVAREYERAGDTAAALAMYLNCRHRGARTRAIRLQCRAQDWEAAHTLCAVAQRTPESAAELQQVHRVLPRVLKKLKLECESHAAVPVIPEFELVLEPTSGSGVEHHVRDHLAGNRIDGSTVHYVENGLITALFGLLCWPAVFAPVPGAFFHDFHHGPVDLQSARFYRRRKELFDACLSHLDSDGYKEVIWKVFQEKWGIQSPFVRWHQIDRPLLSDALACFPAAHLKIWFEWILRDVKENRAGFPDLVQFWPQQKSYRLVEVKAPGDRIQDNQRRLLQHCVAHGMPVSVCHVKWGASACALPVQRTSGTTLNDLFSR